jgi:DNA-binding FrmR family transcriptional regulator
MPDTRPDQHEMLRRLHRTSGQLRAIAEHLRQLAEDLDAMVDQELPPAPADPRKEEP